MAICVDSATLEAEARNSLSLGVCGSSTLCEPAVCSKFGIVKVASGVSVTTRWCGRKGEPAQIKNGNVAGYNSYAEQNTHRSQGRAKAPPIK